MRRVLPFGFGLVIACGSSGGGGGGAPSDPDDTCTGMPDAVELASGEADEITGLDVAGSDVVFSRRPTLGSPGGGAIEKAPAAGGDRVALFSVADRSSAMVRDLRVVGAEVVFLVDSDIAPGDTSVASVLRAVALTGGSPRVINADRYRADGATLLAKDEDSVYLRTQGNLTDTRDVRSTLSRVRVSTGEVIRLAENVSDAPGRVLGGHLYFTSWHIPRLELLRVPVDGSSPPTPVGGIPCGGERVGEDRITCTGVVYDHQGTTQGLIEQAPSSVPTMSFPVPGVPRSLYRFPLVVAPSATSPTAAPKPLRTYALDTARNTRIGCVGGAPGLIRIGASHLVWRERHAHRRERVVALPR